MPYAAPPEAAEPTVDQGPGCLPAVMAAVVLMGIVGFVMCAFMTWVLFQQQSELAVKTLRGTLIPNVEQGLLGPTEKKQVLEQLENFADDLERGKYENWQAGGVMTRIMMRVPIYQWGELQAVEVFLEQQAAEDVGQSLKQISRLKRAVQLGKANAVDLEDVLNPVRMVDSQGPTGYRLQQPLVAEAVADVVVRARLLADRAEIPDQLFSDVSLTSILQDQIEAGLRDGAL